MPAKDIYHNITIRALEKDGWTITNDPLTIRTGKARILIDLGAERLVIAKKGKEQIAVEVKSFSEKSLLYSFHEALGQYLNYRSALTDEKINRSIFLAISEESYDIMISIPFIIKRIAEFNIKLIILDIENETIVEWIN